MVTLDVGCGPNPCGDIAVDITREAKITLLASGEYLPFKDKVFSMVYSHHCLEHVDNPEQMLREMLRVCNGTVFLISPHRLSLGSKRSDHKSFFTQSWFRRFARKYHVPFDVRLQLGFSKRFPFFHVYITVTMWR